MNIICQRTYKDSTMKSNRCRIQLIKEDMDYILLGLLHLLGRCCLRWHETHHEQQFQQQLHHTNLLYPERAA